MSQGPLASLNAWALRAQHVIASGTSTGSKRPDALYGTALAPDLPTHARRSWGCRLETAEGRTLIDLGMALGAVALGYADDEITDAVYETVADGTVCGLAPLLEIEVAERLVDVVPCAEQVRFLKSGAEATAAAVRLARAHTGRTRIIASGYFGWHDWSSPGVGVPEASHAAVRTVPFDDVSALDEAVEQAGTELAAIVLEPLVHRIASAEWLGAARAHCDRLGAVLVFDEIKTAFRVRTGGVQALRGITPDLTTLGKAMANGFPLAAVVGRRSVMSAAATTWISSTLAAETTALVAARVVIDRHARRDVCGELAHIGGRLQSVAREALAAHPIGVRAEGEAPMWQLVADHQPVLDALVAEAARGGVLLKRGAYQFAALAHDEHAIDEVGRVVAAAAARVAESGIVTNAGVRA